MIKILCVVALSLFIAKPTMLNGQALKSTDSLLHAIDQAKRHKYEFRKNRWEYIFYQQKGKTIKIIRTKKDGHSKTMQTFYIHQNQLIYSTETILTFHAANGIKDTIKWAGKYYIHNNKLVKMETLGHGKSEDDNWNAEEDIMTNYVEASDWTRRASTSIGNK